MYKKKPVKSTTVVIRGRGDYTEEKRPYKGFFKYAGGRLGSYFGDTGKRLGQSIGSGMGKFLGFGDYGLSSRVKYNSLLDAGKQVPAMHNIHDGIVISHREYIGDILSSQAFNTTTYQVNPGLSSTFAWLSQIAPAFQQYEFLGLIFEFRSMAGSAVSSTNNALGTIIMSADYNVTNPAYVSKAQQEQSFWAMSISPDHNCILPIECAKQEGLFNSLLVRSQAVNSNQNVQLYDFCNVQVSTQGMQADSINVGELWVTYNIKLSKAIYQPLAYQIPSAHYAAANGTWSPTNPFGGIVKKYDNLGTGITFSGYQIVFPSNIKSGTYLINISWINTLASKTGAKVPIVSLVSGCTYNLIYDQDQTGSFGFPASATTAYIAQLTICVNITAGSAIIAVDNSGVYPDSGSNSGLDVVITQINSNLVN